MPQGLRRTGKKGSVDITEHIKYNTVNIICGLIRGK